MGSSYSAPPRILIGNLQGAFHIAQRLGSMQDVLHINSRAQAVGDQELLKSIATFMAYNPVGKKRWAIQNDPFLISYD